MNRGSLESSPAGGHQIMGGVNPNWWNINSMRPPMVYQQTSSPNFLPFNPPPSQLFPQFLQDHHRELPESWSQLLLGGAIEEDEAKSFDTNWDDNLVLHHLPNASIADSAKEENNSAISYMYGQGDEHFQATKQPAAWHHQQVISTSSPPSSCINSFGNNMLDFINNKSESRHPRPDRSSECNSTANGGALKKARVQTCSAQSTFKVRKEKLGDRITALHQLVSPFGKTDTASVLLEAIGYIRFLQSQIEALSLPYLGNASTGKMRQQQHPGQGDQRSCIFPEDPGQLLHDNYMKNKGSTYQETHEEPKLDLRSRGLCLVPVSCTLQVGNDNGADYWAPPPAYGGGFR